MAIPTQPPVLLSIDAEQQTKKNGAPVRPAHHGHARVASRGVALQAGLVVVAGWASMGRPGRLPVVSKRARRCAIACSMPW